MPNQSSWYRLCLLGLITALVSVSAQSRSPGSRVSSNERMAKLMATTRIPNLQAQDQPLREVLERLKALAQRYSPDNEKLNLMYMGKDDKLDLRVSCELSDLPLSEVLRYVCMAGGLKHRVEEHAVIIFDETVAMEEKQTRIFHVPPDSPIFAPKTVK